MHRGTVVALAVVLKKKLPIAADLVAERFDERQIAERPIGQAVDQRTIVLGKLCGRVLQVEHDEAIPTRRGDAQQRKIPTVESLLVMHVRRPDQATGRVVSPAVIGASQRVVLERAAWLAAD